MTRTRVLAGIGAIAVAASLLAAQEPPAKAPRKPRRQRVVTNLTGFEILDTTKARKPAMVAGATRGDRPPVALAPRLGKTYGTRPVFTWTHEGRARQFVFTLWNDAQEQVHRAEVTGLKYTYPASAPPMEPGTAYFWTVEVSAALMGGVQSAPAGVLVVAAGVREAIRKDLADISGVTYAAELARARVYAKHRTWYDAIAAYTELIGRFPTRAELYEERGMIYAQLEVTRALADEDFARAEELSDGRAR